MKLSGFNKPEQQFLTDISIACKMELQEVITKLFDTDNISPDAKPTLLEQGSLKRIALSSEFYKFKNVDSLSKLPELEEFYWHEHYTKTKANRIKKITISSKKLRVFSVRASKLVELSLFTPNLKKLVLQTPQLTSSQFDCPNLNNILLDNLPNFDFNKLSLCWNKVKYLNTNKIRVELPLEKLTDIEVLILTLPKNSESISFSNKSIKLQAPNLKQLTLSNTDVKELNLKGCTSLTKLSIEEKHITKLLVNYEQLNLLNIQTNNQIINTDQINQCQELNDLRLVDYKAKNLLLDLPKLNKAYFLDPQIDMLDTSSCSNLKDLSVTGRSAEVWILKVQCDSLNLFINYANVQVLDLSANPDCTYLEYTIGGVDSHSIKLICRDYHLLQHEWLKKDFTMIKKIKSNSSDLYQLLSLYNFDFGLQTLKWIIDHPECDKATALQMYWQLGPGWFSQYESQNQISSANLESYKLMKSIEKLYMKGYFKNSNTCYTPDETHVNSYADVMVKERIPEIMFLPSNSNIEQEHKQLSENEVFILDPDYSRLSFQYDCDLKLQKFEGHRNIQFSSLKKIKLPNEVVFKAQAKFAETDYPLATNSWEIFSPKMISLFEQNNIKINKFPLTIIEENAESQKKYNDYYAVQFLEHIDIFDFQNSKNKFRPVSKEIFRIEKIALKQPKDGCPLIFRVKGIEYFIFISKDMKNKMEQANVKGFSYRSLAEMNASGRF